MLTRNQRVTQGDHTTSQGESRYTRRDIGSERWTRGGACMSRRSESHPVRYTPNSPSYRRRGCDRTRNQKVWPKTPAFLIPHPTDLRGDDGDGLLVGGEASDGVVARVGDEHRLVPAQRQARRTSQTRLRHRTVRQALGHGSPEVRSLDIRWGVRRVRSDTSEGATRVSRPSSEGKVNAAC
jgi:hypothetical protein